MFTIRTSLPVLTLAALGLYAGPASAASFTLDFDTDAAGNAIKHGQIIDNEYAAWGVTVSAKHPSRSNLNFAVAYDTTNPADTDMITPGYGSGNDTFLGNSLIVSRTIGDFNNDGLVDKPHSQGLRPGGSFTFNFDQNHTGGSVTVLDVDNTPADFENMGTVQLWLNGILQQTIGIVPLGDNSVQKLTFGAEAFNKIVVQLGGSGGIDNLVIGTVASAPAPAAVSLGLTALSALWLRRRRQAL